MYFQISPQNVSLDSGYPLCNITQELSHNTVLALMILFDAV